MYVHTFEGPNVLPGKNIIHLIPMNYRCDYINFVIVSSREYAYEWLSYTIVFWSHDMKFDVLIINVLIMQN